MLTSPYLLGGFGEGSLLLESKRTDNWFVTLERVGSQGVNKVATIPVAAKSSLLFPCLAAFLEKPFAAEPESDASVEWLSLLCIIRNKSVSDIRRAPFGGDETAIELYSPRPSWHRSES
ncbi:hypothetical protein PG984_009945 [Apiospora sp. TS-2023a]